MISLWEILLGYYLADRHFGAQDKIVRNQDELIDLIREIKENAAIRKDLADGFDNVIRKIIEEKVGKDLIQGIDSQTRRCIQCGSSLLDGYPFCHKCGTKRDMCSCGEFLDSGMDYCPKCGKRKVGAYELKRLACEQKELFEIMQKSGFHEIGENFIDKGDYIELKYPIGTISMIQKGCSEYISWEDAAHYAENIGFGGFKDWRVPTKEELQTIYKIRNICGIIPKNDWFWSSSVDSDDENSAWYVFFSTGQAGSFSKSSIMYCRCVR